MAPQLRRRGFVSHLLLSSVFVVTNRTYAVGVVAGGLEGRKPSKSLSFRLCGATMNR